MRLTEIIAKSDDELILSLGNDAHTKLLKEYKYFETITNSFKEPAVSIYDEVEITAIVATLSTAYKQFNNLGPMSGADTVATETINKLLQYFSK